MDRAEWANFAISNERQELQIWRSRKSLAKGCDDDDTVA
jgi:hypothetical protein